MARFLTDHNALFQHIPRTGGSWVEMAIDRLDIPHIKWLNRQVGNIPNKHALLGHYDRKERSKVAFTFTFVRHPITYYEAVWMWLNGIGRKKVEHAKHNWDWHPKAEAARAFLLSNSYDDFCRNMIDHSPCWITRMYEWYCGPTGGEIVNWVGRTETLQQDFCDVMELLGYGDLLDPVLLRSIGWINGHKSKVHPVWDPGIRKELERLECRAISRFYSALTQDRRQFREHALFSAR